MDAIQIKILATVLMLAVYMLFIGAPNVVAPKWDPHFMWTNAAASVITMAFVLAVWVAL